MVALRNCYGCATCDCIAPPDILTIKGKIPKRQWLFCPPPAKPPKIADISRMGLQQISQPRKMVCDRNQSVRGAERLKQIEGPHAQRPAQGSAGAGP